MSAPTTIRVHLDADEYRRLAAEARRRGVPPGTLAHDLLRAGLEALEHPAELGAELRREGGGTCR